MYSFCAIRFQMIFLVRVEYRARVPGDSVKGKLPGLVVNVKDSQFEPLSLDMGLNPGFTKKLDGKMDHLLAEKVMKK